MFAIFFRHPIRLALLFIWLLLLVMLPNSLELISGYAGFAMLGIIGAIFANATGAGGGVVFVPFFHHLEFSSVTIVATSFAIQCCGMSAGAITWLRYYQHHKLNLPGWEMLATVLYLTVPASLGGIWLVQSAEYLSLFNLHLYGVQQLHLGFGVFSILLAIGIFTSALFLNRVRFEQKLSQFDYLALPVVALLGGMVTAWLSVGVGELVAVYLIVRGFNVTYAIACAVILTALSVWGAIYYHIEVTQAVYWPVILFAGAGAVVGGIVAKRVVLLFSPTKLKLFFATWVLLLGTSTLPLFGN